MAGSTGVVPKASGFKSVVANMLQSTELHDIMQKQCYWSSLAAQVTTTQFNDSFNKGCLGKTIAIQRAPLGQSFSYCADGQALETAESPVMTAVEFSINRSRYTNRMMSELDKLEHCGNKASMMLRDMLEADRKHAERVIDQQLIQAMVASAGCYNKGVSAGLHSGAYNLGAGGAPVMINSKNIFSYLSYVSAVLSEQGCMDGQRKFIILPMHARTIFQNSPLLAHSDGYCCDSSSSSLITGRVPDSVYGDLDIYYSIELCKRTDTGNVVTYAAPFGYKNATAYFFKVVDSVMDIPTAGNPYVKSFGMLAAYDFKVVDERGIGVLYGTFTA